MSTILHLSDLHLGPPSSQQVVASPKTKVPGYVPRAQKDVLKETLRSIGAAGHLNELAAVVVSGDLTSRHERAGFDEFVEFMQPLLEHVAPARVVVVPGNHDVPRDYGPEQPRERYAEFLRVTRKQGFVTPLLDGLDFNLHTGAATPGGRRFPHLLETDDMLLVPLNSSHFCWVADLLAESLQTLVDEHGDDATRDALQSLALHDMPRISDEQMSAVAELLKGTDSASDDRVRVAVLHHQLLPVDAREELKSFEAMTNLGAVRDFLADQGVRVVLHGHKHEGALFWDHVPVPGQLELPPRRMLVAASPGRFEARQLVARLIEVGGRRAARDVVIRDVRAATATAAQATLGEPQRARLWEEVTTGTVGDAMCVKGETADAVYARVQSLFEGRKPQEPLRDLLCEIENPADAGRVPSDFPKMDGLNDVQTWMSDLVDWWQRPSSQLLDAATFNHGERIYRRWGDQLEHVVHELKAAATGGKATTRAIVVLFDPIRDSAQGGVSGRAFPSFVMIQLQVVGDLEQRRLDCTGYFRKQEMRYWWPINIAELATVQTRVIEELARPEDAEPLRRGVLRTFTAYAEARSRIPAAAVPTLDRAVDQRPDELWRMASAIARPPRAKRDRSAVLALWHERLRDLETSDDAGPEPRVSYRGLREIRQYLEWLGADDQVECATIDRLLDRYGEATGNNADRDIRRIVQKAQADLGCLRRQLAERLAQGKPST